MRMLKGYSAHLFLCVIVLSAGIASAAYVPPPPGAPSWWGTHDTPWYSFYRNTGGSVLLDSNEGTGFPITLQKSGSTVTIDMPNGYEATLHKRFYFWIQGTTAGTVDPSFISMTGPNDVIGLSPSIIYGTPGFEAATDVAPNPNTFYVKYEGMAVPQPDRVVFKFNLPSSTSTITMWSVGEQCLPPGNPVPEPASLGLLALGCLPLMRRRSRN
jgi:hypothetical protein